jgi:DNA polymerase III epsilon subunit-like protein
VSNGVMITKESSNIHGITNEISEEKGVPMEAALNAFFESFKVANLVVAHNVDFDKNFVIAEIFRIVKNKMGSKYWLNMATDIACSKKYYCTMQEGTDLCNIKAFTKIQKKEYIKFPTLGELCKHLFGYEPKNMHNAMNDVVVCFQCFYKMYFDLNICEENQEVFDMVKNVM